MMNNCLLMCWMKGLCISKRVLKLFLLSDATVTFIALILGNLRFAGLICSLTEN